MKKHIFVLITAFSMILMSCSWFDSTPIEPEIIGSGNLQYDAVDDIWFTEIGSTPYSVTKVAIPNKNPCISGSVQNITPIEGMLVTLFTSPYLTGIQAIAGRQNVQQIEEMYHEDYSLGVAVTIIIFLICVVAFIICYKCDQQLSNKNAKK